MCYTGGISERQLLSVEQHKGVCWLQWREMAKSKGIRRFRQLYSQWIIYECLKWLPSRGTVCRRIFRRRNTRFGRGLHFKYIKSVLQLLSNMHVDVKEWKVAFVMGGF